MAHPAYGRWSESPQRRFPLGESEDTYDAAVVAQQVADHAFNLREYWAGAQAHQESQRRWAQRKAMARSTVASRRPSGAPMPSDFAAAARRHPEGVRAAYNAKLVAQLQEVDDEKVELWLAQVRAHAVAHGEERRQAVATQAAREAEQCRPPRQGGPTAGTDALVSKALLREYQALAVAGDAEDPDPTQTLVESLDKAFMDSYVVPLQPPQPQSAPPDPHTAAMDGLEHAVAAATASPLSTPLPTAGAASTASISPDTSCVALASATVSPPSVQPADAPIGCIGVTVRPEESGEIRRSAKARRSARETSLERLAKPRGSMHSYSFYKCRPLPPPPAPVPTRHTVSAAAGKRRARNAAVRPAAPVDADATAVVGAPPSVATAAAKAAKAKEAAAAALVREAWAAMEAWDDALEDSNVQQLDRAVEELRLDLQCKGLRTSLEDL